METGGSDGWKANRWKRVGPTGGKLTGGNGWVRRVES